MFFDTHAHYDDEAFDGDRYKLLASMPEQGVSLILNPGCNRDSSMTAIVLSERFPHVYAAVGWHPHDAILFDTESPELIRKWAAHSKVVAIGEIGLDYHYNFSPREVQRGVFIRQLELARELKLPVIIHDREAHGDCMEIIREFPELCGVFHCYSGSPEMAREILKLGWYLSFTGAITFNNARRALETISICPMDRIMLETDAPYLAPVPHRGKRNDSGNLPLIAQVIGSIKGLTSQEVAAITAENGKRFFGIK
ncbi:MAG TPA: TatD family hydrolase [Clostridiales bacterium]|nr:TatD family hydrolase [Clostridiales bacterium]